MNNVEPIVINNLPRSNAPGFSLGVVYIGNFIEFLEFGLFSALLPFISHDFFSSLAPGKRAIVSYLILYS